MAWPAVADAVVGVRISTANRISLGGTKLAGELVVWWLSATSHQPIARKALSYFEVSRYKIADKAHVGTVAEAKLPKQRMKLLAVTVSRDHFW